ncbi:hypothetical protein U1Q18_010131 [Sarracenia purpurea var. burkii]
MEIQHRHKPSERKLTPWLLRQALGRQHIKRVRQDVHEPGGQNDSSGEGLHDHEEVSVWAQGRDGASEERRAHSDHAGDQNAGYGDEFQRQGFGFVDAITVFRRAFSRRNREDLRCKAGEEDEEDRDEMLSTECRSHGKIGLFEIVLRVHSIYHGPFIYIHNS